MAHDSDVRVRKPCILLVQIDPGEEPPELRLRELAPVVHIVHVRQAIPACHRIDVLRPRVVIVGESVLPWALLRLDQAARQVGAALLPLGSLIAIDVGDWLRQALELALGGPASGASARATSQ